MWGIYPNFVEVKCEQESKKDVSFLDVLIYLRKDVWHTTMYDKREHPPLSRVDQKKYPHPSSFLSVRSKFGIITSRMSCFARICTRRDDFVTWVRKLIREFRERGYPIREIRIFVMRFLRTNPLDFMSEGISKLIFRER